MTRNRYDRNEPISNRKIRIYFYLFVYITYEICISKNYIKANIFKIIFINITF